MCPSSCVLQWFQEIQQCTTALADGKRLRVVVVHQNRKKMTKKELEQYDVVLTTYSIVEGEFRRHLAPPPVVCEHCGDCRDVDLCRDERLVEDGTWECLSCDRAYDVEWVESTLVRRVNERLRFTQTQDLRCARDGAIKVGRLASRCACGGLFKCVEHKRAAADDLRVMRSIAESHGFEVLKDVVDWVDERSPNLER